MCFDGTGTGNEGTDSTSIDAYDIGTILSHFHWWILRLSAIPKKSTHWLNNIGLRDASASKNLDGDILGTKRVIKNILTIFFSLKKENKISEKKPGPKGRQLEVGAKRAPGLLVDYNDGRNENYDDNGGHFDN